MFGPLSTDEFIAGRATVELSFGGHLVTLSGRRLPATSRRPKTQKESNHFVIIHRIPVDKRKSRGVVNP
jgi:hypothetical protein